MSKDYEPNIVCVFPSHSASKKVKFRRCILLWSGKKGAVVEKILKKYNIIDGTCVIKQGIRLYLNLWVKIQLHIPGALATVTDDDVCRREFLLVWPGNHYRLQYSWLWPWSVSSCVGQFVISGKPSVALLTKAYCISCHDIPLLYVLYRVSVCVLLQEFQF